MACALVLVCASPAAAATLWAVGDGAVVDGSDDALATFLAGQPIDRFLYLGDVYETGTAAEYATNYDSSFGRFKAITDPTPGNHEWSNRAEGYDAYWSARAPWQGSGGHWYSYDVGGWHVVSLNSEEPIDPWSSQIRWLQADLAARSGTCTLAFVHSPRYSAGEAGDSSKLEAAWAALARHAVLVLSGHEHNYQRLTPERGLTQIIVGTGGRTGHDLVDTADPRLVASDRGRTGALRLDLQPGSASFEFVLSTGEVADSGSLSCVAGQATSPGGGDAGAAASPAPSPAFDRAAAAAALQATVDRLGARLRRVGDRRLARRTRVTVGVTPPVSGRLRLRLRARVGGQRILVAYGGQEVAAGRWAGVALRLTRRGRAALRRPGRLRVTVGAALADLAAMRATRL